MAKKWKRKVDREKYLDGKEAYYRGMEMDDNPERGQARTDWWAGFLDARTGDRLRVAFRNLRISWP